MSSATWATFFSALLVVAVTVTLIALNVGGEFGTMAASDLGEVIVVGLAAVVLVLTARRLGVRTSVGRPWLLIGLGATAFAIGDSVWSFVELGMQAEVPYPGVPDLFYLLEYPLVAFGIMSAGLAFRGLVDIRRPIAIAAATGVTLSAVVYFGLLRPYVLFDAEIALGEKVLSAVYPLADVLLMITPAVFVIATVRTLGGGRLAWPWWAVALGAVLIAAADTGYSWLSVYDLYQSGSFIDYGWSIGHALIMLGGLFAYDMSRKPVMVGAAAQPARATT